MYITSWCIIALVENISLQAKTMDTKAPCSKEMIQEYMAHCAEEKKTIAHVTISDNASRRKGRCLAGLDKVDSPLPARLPVVFPLQLG